MVSRNECQESMKTKKHTDRKTSIENVLREARKVGSDEHEMCQAWLRLCRELEFMTDPEARMPRFNSLMHSLWIAATNDHT